MRRRPDLGDDGKRRLRETRRHERDTPMRMEICEGGYDDSRARPGSTQQDRGRRRRRQRRRIARTPIPAQRASYQALASSASVLASGRNRIRTSGASGRAQSGLGSKEGQLKGLGRAREPEPEFPAAVPGKALPSPDFQQRYCPRCPRRAECARRRKG